MDQKEFIIQLLEALKLPEVREQLAKVMSIPDSIYQDPMSYQNNLIIEEKDLELKQKDLENERLRSELIAWSAKDLLIQDQLGVAEGLNRKLQSKNDELTEQIHTANIKINDFNNLFYKIYNVYEVYLKLSDVSKTELRGIFKEDSPDVWIAAGIQPDNIESLWEYTKMRIMKRQYDDLDGLLQFIYYFIELYNKTKTAPFYILQKVTIGDCFDVDLHIRTSESKAAGKIKQILLYGYINANTSAIIKKSVVAL